MGDNAAEELPFHLSDRDKMILSATDEDFRPHVWDELQDIVDKNRLDFLQRKPSDLYRYLSWSADIRKQYGSIVDFLLAHRLPEAWGRPPFRPASRTPLEDPSDFRVLVNDWPYGFDTGITHIVVWSRVAIETDTVKGDLTPRSRRVIGDFVRRYFVDRLGSGGDRRVLWFKNWVALQSVQALEHFHVLIKDADGAIMEEWTREQECHKTG